MRRKWIIAAGLVATACRTMPIEVETIQSYPSRMTDRVYVMGGTALGATPDRPATIVKKSCPHASDNFRALAIDSMKKIDFRHQHLHHPPVLHVANFKFVQSKGAEAVDRMKILQGFASRAYHLGADFMWVHKTVEVESPAGGSAVHKVSAVAFRFKCPKMLNH